jgi:hypothetical protein
VLHEPGQPGRFVIDDRKPVLIPDWLAELHPEPGDDYGVIANIPNANEWLKEYGGGELCDTMANTQLSWLNQMTRYVVPDMSPHDWVAGATLSLVGDCVAGHTGLNDALRPIRATYFKARGYRPNSDRVADWRNCIATAIEKKIGGRGRPKQNDPCSVEDDLTGLSAAVQKQKAEKFLASIKNGTWLDQQKFAPLQYAIPNLLPEGYAVLAGGPFTGKSVLLVQFGLACARGAYVFGVKCPKRHVYYLALETSLPRLQELCQQVLGDNEIPLWFNFEIDVAPKQLIPRVEAYLKVYPDALIMIDTLARAMEPPQKGETTYDRDYRIGARLKDLDKRYTGCTIIASRHTRKGKADDWIELVSGTNAITGAADSLMILSRTRGSQDGRLQITSRVMDEAEYAVMLERPLGWHLDGEDLDQASDKASSQQHVSRLGERSQEIIDFVNDNPNGVTAEEVAKETGIDIAKVRVNLSNNVKRGNIMRIKTGVYGPTRKLRAGSGKEDDDD